VVFSSKVSSKLLNLTEVRGMPLKHLLQSSAEIATLKRVPKTPMDLHATLLELL
jgi:hypothetical protein